ncbi:bifunctional glutamate N-acetyltransferase/amino-acid acetyltransferase ArgJ [Phenylobacterium sp.]|uniref:bifunctional glutamate N-acetyltransferase/amino-acid acetyltransferase ArgJ n=1 Tax=Phenylobacterium sp. TaxID=1871053 RepID=UPI00286B1751|nr:bifunctional glutamate N-acetyltransferase/amino-acid acetyltransferase ArgJ [Phenylobacterium sp.]
MTRKPTAKPPNKPPGKPAAKVLEAATRPVEVVGQTLERAYKQARNFAGGAPSSAAPSPAKAALPVSPLAVAFPAMPPIAGVRMATARAGFYKHERDDLLVMTFPMGASAAGVFTRHGVGSAPVDWCKRHLEMTKGEGVRALVVNAGCANSFTGRPGADAVRRVCSAAAKRFDCRQRDVMVASTGVIGVLLDDARIVHRLPDIEHRFTDDGWAGAAQAIMTTDTFPKGAHAVAEIDGVEVRISGIAKGSGMIAPDMATMLAFVVTDAAISPGALQNLVSLYTRSTFNAVTVDGDRSTNDTLLLFATGQSGAAKISRAGDRRLADFRDKLEQVLMDLAQQLVRDGEGAAKFITVTVTGAQTHASARKIARTICESPLVKTAFAGEDANWGRIVMAVGRADEPMDRDSMSVKFGDLVAAHDGLVSPTYDEAKMSAYMKNSELEVSVDVGVGRAAATMWTCDLTKRYVEINGDYRS